MAYVSSEFAPSRLGSQAPEGANAFAFLNTALNAAFEPLRRRWTYRQIIADLEQYPERNLADIGAEHGIKAFARRAAGL